MAGGFTQTTGDVDVSVSFASDGDNSPTFLIETSDSIYVEGGEGYDQNSSLRMFGEGDAETSTTTIDFAAATGADVEDEVENVSFRISDIDWGDANHQDQVVINAFDAGGNPIPVTITPTAASNETIDGSTNTITAGLFAEDPDDESGSVLIEIPGPVAQVTISYSNLLDGTQAVFVSDVFFETIPADAISSDSLDGGADNDSIDGFAGDDTITGGTGNDTMTGGVGDDVFVLADGSGADVITDYDTGDTNNDGFFNDQLDVTGLTDAGGNPVNAWDVVVSDDGSGNALLSFPNGETIVLQGVTPAEVTGAQLLNAAGIPCFTDGTLIRTPRGEVPIETLKEGDLVTTLENGDQPIRWAGRRHLGPRELMAFPQHKPICIPEGVLGNYAPLFVSPLHGMVLDAAHLGEEMFARAKHLVDVPGPVRVANGKRRVTYHHLMFDAHQIVFANGALAESFYPGDCALEMYPAREVARIKALVPDLDTKPAAESYGPTARPFARRKDIHRDVDLRPRTNPFAIAAE
ncbi:MAG: Hint domain-containing protein [Pseudomonadota bacterium]